MNNGVVFDKKLTEEKLKYYKKHCAYKAFVEALSDMDDSVDCVTFHSNSPDRELGTKYNSIILILCKKEIWLRELSPLVLSLLPFSEVRKAVLKRVREGI